MRGDWLRTGDAAYIDLEGYLYLINRVKDMIVSGGENVYSAVVEAALATLPAVLQCAVIGVPDGRLGERVHAVLQVRPEVPVTDADLLEHCSALIVNYRRPKSFDLRTTPLPMLREGPKTYTKPQMIGALGPIG